VPLILSGGINAANVAEAIAACDPFAVDSASGTESAPGHKDLELMRNLFAAVRAATAPDAAPGESAPAADAGPDAAATGAPEIGSAA
jgi:phosphoribosylanthranilate isomerase